MLQERNFLVQSDDWILGEKHALWDLSRVYIVLKKLLADPDASKMDWPEKEGDTPQKLASDIKDVIEVHAPLLDNCLREAS